jgi:hypothetical protein
MKSTAGLHRPMLLINDCGETNTGSFLKPGAPLVGNFDSNFPVVLPKLA